MRGLYQTLPQAEVLLDQLELLSGGLQPDGVPVQRYSRLLLLYVDSCEFSLRLRQLFGPISQLLLQSVYLQPHLVLV